MNIILVALGAGAGGGLRYWISSLVSKFFPVIFPFGTLIVNVLGSFILGILILGFDEKELLNQNYKLLIGTGFCGGLTTFSTFSLETFSLMRDANYTFALINILANVAATLVGIYVAHLVTK